MARRNRRNRRSHQQPLPGPRPPPRPITPVAAALAPDQEPEQPLAHRRLEERALREGWRTRPDERERIIGRLLRTIDREDRMSATDAGIGFQNDREATAASRALIYAELGARRLDLVERIHADRQYAAARSEEADTYAADPVDPARYDWYGETCPCDLPAGDCGVHPRARTSQRPPDGDWRVWAYVAGRGHVVSRGRAQEAEKRRIL